MGMFTALLNLTQEVVKSCLEHSPPVLIDLMGGRMAYQGRLPRGSVALGREHMGGISR